MPDYVVLLHEDPSTTKNYSPTQVQALIQRYSEWIGGLRARGHATQGQKLTDEGGRHLRMEKGKMVVSEGPYAEAKDVLTGYFVVTAASYEEAQALLASGPHYEFGWIELREVDPVN